VANVYPIRPHDEGQDPEQAAVPVPAPAAPGDDRPSPYAPAPADDIPPTGLQSTPEQLQDDHRDQDQGDDQGDQGDQGDGIDVDGDGRPDLIIDPGQPMPWTGGQSALDLADTRPAGDLVPVDPALAPGRVRDAVIARRDGQRADILPGWAKSSEGMKAAAGWVWSYYWHALRFHAVRSPIYLAKVLLILVPRGLVRATAGLCGWLSGAESAPLRAYVVAKDDPATFLALKRQQQDQTNRRLLILAGALLAALVAAVVAPIVVPGPVLLLVPLAALAGLAVLGRDAAAPVLGRAVTTFSAPRLTADTIVAALGALGIAELNKAIRLDPATGVGFPAPIQRETLGWRADIDLPLGVVPADVAEKRSELASGLRRRLGCVWPEADPTQHEGRLILHVLDKDFASMKPPAWPLAERGQHDYFTPYLFGWDYRGQEIPLCLFEINILVGALPGQGKSATMRVAASASALDPTVELWIAELAGKGDFAELEPVAHRYVNGVDDASIRAAAAMLSELRAECERRLTVLGEKVPASMKPDKKVTRQIANHPRWGLHPLVGILDEAQNVFIHKDVGKQAGEDAETILRLSRAVAVTLLLGTQIPDSKSVPPGVTRQAAVRFALKVADQVANDMVLGTGMYKRGYQANTFRAGADAGLGLLAGVTTNPVTVRSAYLDGPAVEKIAKRARTLREEAGTLSGHALGEDTTREHPDQILLDVVRTWPDTGRESAWSEEIAAQLAAYSTRYDGYDATAVGDEMRRRGIEVKDRGRRIEGVPTTRKGVALPDVRRAIQARGLALAGGDQGAIEAGRSQPDQD